MYNYTHIFDSIPSEDLLGVVNSITPSSLILLLPI